MINSPEPVPPTESAEKSKPGSLSRRPKAYFGEGGSGRRALHSPAGRDVIPSQTRRATGGAHRERWRDRPCETAATGEAYRQASWQVPTPAEETPTDESKDMATKPLFTVRARNNNEGGLLLSLNLREIFENRIPLRTSQSRGWRTRGYSHGE
jgi:hypothetical protein